MLPDLNSLALFVRAAELGNLTRAADASHITVPAASRRLSQLEHQFKTRLFERHSRGLELTPAGEHLLQLSRDVLADIQQLHAEMANYAAGQQAVLRVHGNTSAMAQFLPLDIARFQSKHESLVRIVLEECWSADAVNRVNSGVADLGVIVSGADVAGLYCMDYRRDKLAAILREDDPLSAETLAFADLLDRDIVGLEGGSTLTRLLTAQAAEQLRPMALRVQVRSFEAVCRAVQARLGIGILPFAAARGFVNAMRLRVVPLTDSWAERRMQLILRREPEVNSPLGALAAHLNVCAESPEGE